MMRKAPLDTNPFFFFRFLLGIMAALFVGFSFFLQNTSSTGLQNTLFAIFMLLT